MLHSSRQVVSLSDCAVMTWGGLRGAVGLALAVQVRIHRAEDDDGNPHIDKKDAHRVLFYVSGVAFLTLLINATTCPILVKRLGIAATPSAKRFLQHMLHEQLVRHANATGQPKEVTQRLGHVLTAVKRRIYKQKSSKDNIIDSMIEERASMTIVPADFSMAPAILACNSMRQAHSDKLIKEFQEVQGYFTKIRKDELDLLGALPEMILCSREETLIAVMESLPVDWSRLDAVNGAFLNLVLSQYRHLLEVRDLSPGSFEAGVLLSSISLARSQMHGELLDFHFVLPYIVFSEDELSERMAMTQNAAGFRDTFSKERRAIMHKNLSLFRTSRSPSRMSRAPTERMSRVPSDGKHPSRLESCESGINDSAILRQLSMMERTRSCIDSMTFNITMAILIVLNGIYIAVEENYRNSGNDGDLAWLVIEIIFTAIFTVECVLKFSDEGWAYFSDSWNIFDFILVVLGISGLVINTVVTGMGDTNVSNEARIVRIARVFRVFRLLRLFRLIRYFEVLKSKLTREEYSPEVAEHMQKMTILTCYIRAHLLAQNEFFHFFCGLEDNISSAEVARCMLQSQAFVYMAICLSVKELKQLDKELLKEINMIRESKEITEELEKFVMSAYEHGVLGGREAEAVVSPLHHHIKGCMEQIERSQRGHGLTTSLRIIPRTPGTNVPTPLSAGSSESEAWPVATSELSGNEVEALPKGKTSCEEESFDLVGSSEGEQLSTTWATKPSVEVQAWATGTEVSKSIQMGLTSVDEISGSNVEDVATLSVPGMLG